MARWSVGRTVVGLGEERGGAWWAHAMGHGKLAGRTSGIREGERAEDDVGHQGERERDGDKDKEEASPDPVPYISRRVIKVKDIGVFIFTFST